ncbi:glycoside hydrolase family 31 protein [Pseudohyphozyma bogoriensis]|nr:glycoside hydrolase family 31 protein [Pseudohyphozyma bogoriensis]
MKSTPEPAATARCSRRPLALLLSSLVLLVLTLVPGSTAVKRHDFKTCAQSGFCARNRALADRRADAAATWTSPYAIVEPAFKDGVLSAGVKNALYPSISFGLEVSFQKDGVARLKMDEVGGLRQRYNEAAMWAVQSNPEQAVQEGEFTVKIGKDETSVKYAGGRHEVRLKHSPVLVTFLRDGVEQVVLNDKGLLNMEHFRIKSVGKPDEETVVPDQEHPGEQIVIVKDEAYPGFLPENEDGMWEETFGGKTDSKPKGPESLSLDITFPGYSHVYGIPQHASSLSLKQTRGGEGAYTDPYRLYNLDVFEYDADSEMAIYGSIPFMKAHRPGSTVGVFLVSGSETWIDITKESTPRSVNSQFKSAKSSSADKGPTSLTTTTHWMAESGILDLFVFLGPTPNDLFQQYTSLTGKIPLPQLFAIAYHQCRWNYQSEDDVLGVVSKFDEVDIPMDVIWLDIEYAEDHKYFIWDRRNFPTPEKMQESLGATGRKLVAIIDPHIKRVDDLYIYKEAKELDILSKTSDGKEYEGWCWTGSSAWTDWFNPKSWDWWISQFTFEKFKGSTKYLYVWNDMNEPSVFNGPEITMQKDTIHYGGWEHRDVHNIGGMIYQNVTAQGLIGREEIPKRPFVLTRAFYAGSQRFGAMWTGDNLGTWEHLASTVPMLLTNGIAGMTFSGADVGGFFGNPSIEMMVRWYQVGAFSPFFRAHGHIDTKRREPYLFDQPHQGYMRDAVRLRYSILPTMYTAFFDASKTGIPILRPQYVVFPEDSDGYAIDDQFYLGSSGLLVKPVVTEGAVETEIYISDNQPYYNYFSHEIVFGGASGGAFVKVPAPLSNLPAYHQGGSIFARRDLVRRSAILTWRDPITLVVALDHAGTSASGSLYLDDGETFAYEKGEYVHRGFDLAPQSAGDKTLLLKSRSLQAASTSTSVAPYHPSENAWAKKISDVTVRKVIILGLASKPSCVKRAGSDVGLQFDWTDGLAATAGSRRGGARAPGKKASELVIHDAGAEIVQDWDIVFEFGGAGCSVTPAVDYEIGLQSPLCPAGRFRCANEGHIPSCILTSRVNDGICDPECCDGSDETDGKVACANVCAKVGAEYRKQKDEEARKRRVGASVRQDYIKFGAKEKSKLQAEIETVTKEIRGLEEREVAAKASLEALESAEAGEIERKKNSALYQSIVEMQSAIKSLRAERAQLEGHVAELSSVLSELSRDFNPNYQDMAVLGASRAYKSWRVSSGLDEASTEEGSEQENLPGDEDFSHHVPAPVQQDGWKDYADSELEELSNEDPLSLIDSLSTRVGTPAAQTITAIFNVQEYIPEAWKPKFDEYKTALLSILSKTGIITAQTSSDADRPELTRARAAHSTLVEEIKKATNRREDAEKALERDWGRDWEWKKLDGTCVENNLGEYTYSVCFFGEATQKSNNNNARTSLGNWSSWSSSAEPGTDAYYEKHVYDNGQRCWNGPLRSAKVDFICGTSNALLSVVEPEKCEYLFTVSTPAVCFPLEEQTVGGAKDEL